MQPKLLVVNQSKPFSPPLYATLCNTFYTRFLGLMFKKDIKPDSAILIDEKFEGRATTSIHMFFMNFDILAIWINKEGRVVDVQLAHRWRPYYAAREPARYILETHCARLPDFEIGDQLEFKDA